MGRQRLVLQVYFAMVIIGGIITLGSLLQIPTEASNAAIFGLSKERLLMVGGILIVILGATGILITSWVRKFFFTRFEEYLVRKLQRKAIWGWSILFCSMLLFGSAYLIFLIPEITEPFTQAYFIRLQPIIAWTATLSAQTLVALPLLRYGFALQAIKPRSQLPYKIAVIFSLLLLLWILIAQTQIGLTPTDAGAGWNALGTPLLETQAFAAWIIAVLYIVLAIWGENHLEILERIHRFKLLRFDLVISIILWASAFALWNSIPLTANWFAAPPRPPNQAIYPNSDAYLYDTTGHTLLTGEGFKTQNTPFAIRPLYALFLSGMHALGGLDYEPMIWMQVAVLALIPVLLYWITLHIHNRVSALIAASLLIFRETNAIILGSSITTSHSKLLMADLPTTLGVMLLILIIIHWLQNPAQRLTLTLIAGGLTGAFMLIRPEFAILLPFLGLAALLESVFTPKSFRVEKDSLVHPGFSFSPVKIWLKGMLLIIIGTMLFLLPWIWRNYALTGTIFLDSPHYRSDLIALRYQEYSTDDQGESQKEPISTADPTIETQSPPENDTAATTAVVTPTPNIAYQSGENGEAFASRMFSRALNYTRNNLGAVLHFIANHFLNSQVQSVLYLPATFRLPDSAVGFLGHKDPTMLWGQCCSAQSYIRRLPFWFKWDGNLPRQSILPLALNLFLITIGLVSAWKQQKFIGLLPLFASIGYTLINALVRNSGGRYILPVDWISIFYFSIGLGQLTLWVFSYFRSSELPSAVLSETHSEIKAGISPVMWRRTNLGIAILIILLGSILPLAEKIIPPLFPPYILVERQNQVLNTLDLPLELLLAGRGQIIQGRAIYPRFHDSNQGEAGTRLTPFSPLPFSRLDFYMVGPYNGGIVLAQDTAPTNLPNGVDVLVIGCPKGRYFDALVVVTFDQTGNPDQIFLRQPFPETISCPLPPP